MLELLLQVPLLAFRHGRNRRDASLLLGKKFGLDLKPAGFLFGLLLGEQAGKEQYEVNVLFIEGLVICSSKYDTEVYTCLFLCEKQVL